MLFCVTYTKKLEIYNSRLWFLLYAAKARARALDRPGIHSVHRLATVFSHTVWLSRCLFVYPHVIYIQITYSFFSLGRRPLEASDRPALNFFFSCLFTASWSRRCVWGSRAETSNADTPSNGWCMLWNKCAPVGIDILSSRFRVDEWTILHL